LRPRASNPYTSRVSGEIFTWDSDTNAAFPLLALYAYPDVKLVCAVRGGQRIRSIRHRFRQLHGRAKPLTAKFQSTCNRRSCKSTIIELKRAGERCRNRGNEHPMSGNGRSFIRSYVGHESCSIIENQEGITATICCGVRTSMCCQQQENTCVCFSWQRARILSWPCFARTMRAKLPRFSVSKQ